MTFWFQRAIQANRIGIRLPEEIGALFADVFGRSVARVGRTELTSRVVPGPAWRPSIPRPRWPSRESSPVWRRSPGGRIRRLPLYGGVTLPRRNVLVSLPLGVDFWEGAVRWDDGQPGRLPQISIGVPRAVNLYRQLGLPLPAAELALARGLSSMPDEDSRRRRDVKFGEKFGAQQYRNALSLVNRTYGTMDEYREALTAYHLNPDDPMAFMMALAGNEAIDRLIGARARLLKQHVYSSRFYPLPVGIDVVSRLWQGM